MKKRITTFLLAIVMILSFLPANAFAFNFNDDDECELYPFASGKDAYAISHIDIFADIVTPVSINGAVYEYHQPLTTADAQYVSYSGKYADGTPACVKLIGVGTSEDATRGLQIRLGADDTTEDNYLEAGTQNDPVYWNVSFNKTTKLYISDDRIESTPFSGAEEYEIPINLSITVDYWSDKNECPGGPDEEYPIPFVYSGIDIDLGTVYTAFTYTLTYHVVGDTVYGPPADSVTPDGVDGIKHNADEELETVPKTDWTTSDGTANGVPGTWTVSEYWTEDADNPGKADITDGKIDKITSDKDVYAKWTFTPDTYTLTYHVISDDVYGTPSDSVTPDIVDGIIPNTDKDLKPVPNTAWTTSDGTANGIPGIWAVSEYWTEDAQNPDKADITDSKIEKITSDKDVYVKWTFTPDTYTLTYNVAGDDTYGTPADSKTPAQKTGIAWDGSVDPLAEIPTTSWTTSDGTGSGVPGKWEFTPAWSSDDTYADELTKIDGIKENKNVYGKWTFTPDTFTLTYNVDGDETYGTPTDSATPTQVTGINWNGSVDPLAEIPTTSWTTSDGTDSGVPGIWTFTGWSSDATYGDDLTEKNIKQDETVYGKWIFIPDTYEVTYVVEPDDKWGVPDDSVTPEDDSVYDYKDNVIVEENLTSLQDYAVNPKTGDKVPGAWIFTPWDREDFQITEDSVITGSWTFVPNAYKVDYVVNEDPQWGIPKDSKTPTDITAYEYKEDVTVTNDLATKQDYAVDTETGDEVPGTWTFTPWDKDDFQITENTTITGSWSFTPNTYKVEYVINGDKTYGLPDDSVTPIDPAEYNYKNPVDVADELTSSCDYALVNGGKVKGTWKFVRWDKEDFMITEDTVITGAWQFIPDKNPTDPILPQTDDTSNLGLWIALFAVSGIALIGIGLGKKRKTRVMQ